MHEIPSGGVIVSAWKKKGDRIVWTFEVPFGTEAEIVFPGCLDGSHPNGLTVGPSGTIVAAPGSYRVTAKLFAQDSH